MTALEIEKQEDSEKIRLRSAADGRLIAYTAHGPVAVRVAGRRLRRLRFS